MSVTSGSRIYASDINQNLIIVTATSPSNLSSAAVGDDITLATVDSSYFTNYYFIGCVAEMFGQQRSLGTMFLQVVLLPTGTIKGVRLFESLSTGWDNIPLHFIFLKKNSRYNGH